MLSLQHTVRSKVNDSTRPCIRREVAALARLGPAKRTAILTLTDPDEGKHEA